MLVLTVTSYNGQPAEPLSVRLDERGGSIGRAEGNQLVLPDSERTVSRRHAQVVFRNGSYCIVDQGSNPIAVNGQEVGRGREQPVRPGDTVQLGGYVLSVGDGQVAAGHSDPFADLFQDKTVVRAPAAAPRPVATPAPPAAASASASASARGPLIPEDWNPFGPETPPRAHNFDPLPLAPVAPLAPLPTAANAPLQPLVQSQQDSLDQLFNLGPGAPAADPFARGPQALPPAQPNTAADTDPLRALQRAAPPVRPPIPDDFPDLKTPWSEPARASTPPPAAPPGAVLSWEQSTGPRAPASMPLPVAAPVPPPLPVPAPAPPPVAAVPVPVRAPATAAGPGAPADALLAALLDGLELPSLPLQTVDESLMYRLGALLRASTKGTVELLVARAALKREVRAELTAIVARENNPLKFSPTADSALAHLLGPLEAGFSPPIAAMQDAYDDLRAHQVGVVAGMRAALEGVLARFDPAQLESQLVPRSGLAGLLPANRKARLWEAFESLHAQLATEAEDAFHALYGRAFLQAYEDHIEQLQQQSPRE